MKFVFPQNDFVKALGLFDHAQYEMFNDKLNKELAEKLHPSAMVNSLDFISTWKDSGGNTHATLKGLVRVLGDGKEIGAEFVWLKTLKRFRGKVWSSVEIPSDLQLLMMARDRYRKSDFRKAKEYLNAIQQMEDLPRSAIRLRSLIERRIESE